jgi:hypothetical protein
MHGAGEHVQLGGYSGDYETTCIFDAFTDEKIKSPDADMCGWKSR